MIRALLLSSARRARSTVARAPATLLGIALAAALVPAAAAGIAACTTDTAIVGITPITGVVVRSSALVSGIGCGTGDAQIFKYVAVVTSQDGSAAWAGAYDCFADAVFVNLPFTDGGTTARFAVKIFAYTKAAFDAPDVAARAASTFGPLTAASDADIAALEAAATWRSDCKATQQPNVEVLACCTPLASPGGSSGSSGSPVDAGDVCPEDESTTP